MGLSQEAASNMMDSFNPELFPAICTLSHPGCQVHTNHPRTTSTHGCFTSLSELLVGDKAHLVQALAAIACKAHSAEVIEKVTN